MITSEEARRRLNYNPLTGELTWKQGVKYVTGGAPAFASTSPKGYLRGSWEGKGYLQHRVVWLWVTGNWPKQYIDHINGIMSDNRWVNLRDVSHQRNLTNQRARKNNTSGVMGVCYYNEKKRWKAYIGGNKRRIHLGYFCNVEDAIAARKQAEKDYGYDENHGLDRK